MRLPVAVAILSLVIGVVPTRALQGLTSTVLQGLNAADLEWLRALDEVSRTAIANHRGSDQELSTLVTRVAQNLLVIQRVSDAQPDGPRKRALQKATGAFQRSWDALVSPEVNATAELDGLSRRDVMWVHMIDMWITEMNTQMKSQVIHTRKGSEERRLAAHMQAFSANAGSSIIELVSKAAKDEERKATLKRLADRYFNSWGFKRDPQGNVVHIFPWH